MNHRHGGMIWRYRQMLDRGGWGRRLALLSRGGEFIDESEVGPRAAALYSRYGQRVKVSESSVESIINTLRVERGMVIMPEPKGRGLVLTYSPSGVNATPAIIDHTESIVAAQRRAAATIQNQIVGPTFELSIRMIPASQNTLPADAESHLRMIQDGNNNMATRLLEAKKASSVRYRLVPFIEESNEIQGGRNTQLIEGK